MPKKFPATVCDRAVRMSMDHSSEYPTLFAAYKTMAPELDVGVETLLIGVVEAQIDAGVQVGPSSDELEEIR